jgi:flavin-dependent thymidylate synthase
MKVLLSGYNFDADIINELKEKAGWKKDNITPETLSAAYARISRDPRDIEELRREAREEVDKSRKSNETIIFGLGHASVAEHAYFNFDIIGLSRLAVEQVQKFRMASFTEKSQRYITLDGDFVIPEEIKEAGFEKEFTDVIALQNRTYNELYAALEAYLFKENAEMITKKNGRRTVEGWAKEDARYVVSLTTESQFGMSINARSLENMLRQLRMSELKECRDLSQKLYDLVKNLSPSIIKYIEPTDYDTSYTAGLKEMIGQEGHKGVQTGLAEEVRIVDHTAGPDRKIAAAIVSDITGASYGSASEIVSGYSDARLKDLFVQAFKNRTQHDALKRHFEFADATFEIILSATNYAQLKRHRMASILTGSYDAALGFTMPPNIEKVGMKSVFEKIMNRTEEFYYKLNNSLPDHAPYVLTNAHRRRILLRMNFRELYHFAALRLDEHAQWDIRITAEKMLAGFKKIAPFLH